MLKPSPALLKKYSQVFPIGTAGSTMPQILIQRRKAHLAKLDSFAVFSGLPREPGAEHLWVMSGLRIFQEPALMHLTGINQTQIILILNPFSKDEKEILFVPQKDPKKEFWDGVRLGLAKANSDSYAEDKSAITTLTGITCVKPIQDFVAYFQKLVKANKKGFAYTLFHSYPNTSQKFEPKSESKTNSKSDSKQKPKTEKKPPKILETKSDYNWVFKEYLEKLSRLASTKKFAINTWIEPHFALRLPLEKFQVKDVEWATEHTHQAFRDTLQEIKNCHNENEVACYIEYAMKKRSPFGLSFPSIIASGKNATVLHYLKNDEALDPKGLILLDFGVRFGTMHADISRTIPASGRYNPLQKLLYNVVLAAQLENQKNVCPNATIRELNKKVWLFLEEKLQSDFFEKGGKAKRSYNLQPHGVSHLMGEQEHDGDPHRLYQDYPLQIGWMISSEPGLYGYFEMIIAGVKYSEWIGIRIEDNLLITTKGCRNMSAHIPKEVLEIEALMSK